MRMVKSSALLVGLLCSSLLCVCCRAIVFDYDNQAAWPPICNVDNKGRQSPINIITANVVKNSTLSALKFSPRWSQAVSDGTFVNNGHSVQLTLGSSSPTVSTRTPVGNYKLVQMHFHWGSMTGTGSEHRINGKQAELEVHFVHSAIGTGVDPGRAYAVIGVLAEVSSEPLSGAWKTLDVSQLVHEGDSISITDFTLSSLLPEDRDYYYYPGSLTTPPCTESVQWFVLKNRIRVPAAYLKMLHKIRGQHGVLTYNFRMVQQLNCRKVSTPVSKC